MSVRGSGVAIFKRTVVEAGVLLLLALVIALLAWLPREHRLSLKADASVYEFKLDFPLMPVSDALTAFSEGEQYFVDIRPESAFSQRVPGAFVIRPDSFEDDLLEILDFIAADDPLIIYGDGDLQRAAAMAVRFRDRGYTSLSLMDGGLSAWRDAGGECEEGER